MEKLIRSWDELRTFIREVKYDFPWFVRVLDGRNRSKQQNSLMWTWAYEIQEQTGYTKEEVQAKWKADFGIPMLSDESEDMRNIYGRIPWEEGDPEEIMKMLEWMPCTRHMTQGQMTRFLDRIFEYHTTKCGHILTIPEDGS